MKQCNLCGLRKSVTEFDRKGTTRVGTPQYQRWCQACRSREGYEQHWDQRGAEARSRHEERLPLRAAGLVRCKMCDQVKSLTDFYAGGSRRCKFCWYIHKLSIWIMTT